MAKQISAIILAAGSGTRIGADRNKVFLEIASRPLLSYTIGAFAKCEQVDEIIVVAAPGEEEDISALLDRVTKDVKIVPGGARRQDSSYAGVRAASGDVVLIHDAARPFVSTGLITRLIREAQEHGACVPALPVADTLRPGKLDSPLASILINRSHLLRMQTPQAFSRTLILEALSESMTDFTDDAAAILACGNTVWTIEGEETNIKVTTRQDLVLAEMIAAKAK